MTNEQQQLSEEQLAVVTGGGHNNGNTFTFVNQKATVINPQLDITNVLNVGSKGAEQQTEVNSGNSSTTAIIF